MAITIDKKIWLAESKDYFGITFGLVMYAFGFTFFLMPYEIVTGGVAGIAAITQYATQIPNQYTYFLVNAALLLVGLKILGWKFLMKTIYAIIVLTFLLGLMKEFVPRDEAELPRVGRDLDLEQVDSPIARPLSFMKEYMPWT